MAPQTNLKEHLPDTVAAVAVFTALRGSPVRENRSTFVSLDFAVAFGIRQPQRPVVEIDHRGFALAKVLVTGFTYRRIRTNGPLARYPINPGFPILCTSFPCHTDGKDANERVIQVPYRPLMYGRKSVRQSEHNPQEHFILPA